MDSEPEFAVFGKQVWTCYLAVHIPVSWRVVTNGSNNFFERC